MPAQLACSHACLLSLVANMLSCLPPLACWSVCLLSLLANFLSCSACSLACVPTYLLAPACLPPQLACWPSCLFSLLILFSWISCSAFLLPCLPVFACLSFSSGRYHLNRLLAFVLLPVTKQRKTSRDKKTSQDGAVWQWFLILWRYWKLLQQFGMERHSRALE